MRDAGPQGPAGDNCANTVRIHDSAGGPAWIGRTSDNRNFTVEGYPLSAGFPALPNQPPNTYNDNAQPPTPTNTNHGLDVCVPQLPLSAPEHTPPGPT